LISGFFPNLDFYTTPKSIYYNIHSDSIKITTEIKTRSNNEVVLYSVEDKEDKVLSINDFNKMYKIDSIEKFSHSKTNLFFWRYMRILGIICIAMGSLRLITILDFEKKEKKILTNASA
jgi:hypothetical protein